MSTALLTNCENDSLLTDCSGSRLLTDCAGVVMIRYTWTSDPYEPGFWTYTSGGWVYTRPKGGFDLFSETTFLGRSLGWISNGLGPAWYMTWFVNETPYVGGYEEYTVRVDDAHADGMWVSSTTISLEADWFQTPGNSLTVTVTYNGVTQVKVISPSSITTVETYVAGPDSQIVTPVGHITVNADGTFSLH